MGLFARGCVSPVLISGGQQPSQRVPASFRRPAEPRNGAEHRRSVPLRRAPFWTFTRRSGTVPWEGRQACDGCDDRIPATYIRRAANRRPLHRSPEPSPVRSGRCCLRGCQSPPLVQRSPAAHSGETDHPFRWQTDHLFRRKPITCRSEATRDEIMSPGSPFGSTVGFVSASSLLSGRACTHCARDGRESRWPASGRR